jgi:hypothetical protein
MACSMLSNSVIRLAPFHRSNRSYSVTIKTKINAAASSTGSLIMPLLKYLGQFPALLN